MMTEEQFNELVSEIQSLGYDIDTATYYAARIGDRPIRDQDGNIVVQMGDKVLARLKLKSFGASGTGQ